MESIGDAAFKYCVSLGSVDLSSTRVSSIGQEAFSNCSSLSTFVTPATPVSVGKNAFTDCRDLVELRLASADVTLDSNQGATNAQFHVSMANTVDVLASDDISALASMGCDSISFEGPNYLTITGGDWQVDFLPDQLKGLAEGDYFVDAQGVWYRIDAAADSASVFYCPAGIVTYTVAKELPAREEGGAAIPVTGVDSFAFGSASDLTSLDFESPDAITVLSDRAFAGATNLQGINGKSTASEVLATFTAEGLDAGTMLFWKTKIAEADSGDSGLTGEDIIITKDNLTLTVSTAKGENADPAQSDDGVYNYYTGESARTTITVSADSAAVEDGAVVRAYFQFDSKSGNLNYKTGEYPVESSAGNTYMMTVFKTDTENCYCVEFERPKQGDTLSITLESNYPSPTSAGGSALLWASILSAEEKGATGSKATAADTYQGMNWTTVVDTFPVTKKRSSTSLTLCGDGTGSAYLQGLSYDISMKREGSTLEGIGKDLMTSVTFEDVLTLPEGVTLADDVVQSIKDGTVTIKWGNNDGYGFYTSAGRLFLRIMPNPQSNYQYMRNGAVSLDDNGNLVVRWTFVNSHLSLNPPTEMDDLKFTYSVYSNTLIVKDPQPEVTYTLHNAVTATQHFMHSADQVQASECDAQTSKADSSLTLTKDHKKYSSYYGGSERYLITATNPGALPYEGLAYLTDDLPATLYMRPADLASAFGQDEGHQLTVTIKNVSICTSSGSKTVTGLDGASGTTDPQYSGQNTTYSGKSYADPDSQSSTATLTVCWDGNALKISVDGGAEVPCAADEASIQAALQQLGFVVNPATQYCLSWNLQSEGGTVAPLPGGAKIEKAVPCALKDTFMLLDADVDNQHPTSNISISNTAHAKNLAGVDLRSCSTGYYSSNREFSLNKSWSLGGASIDEGTAIGQGDVLDYSLAVTHQNNDAYYDALPLVDRMSGAQALMVPADKNSGASWAAGMKAVTYDGVEYYVLSMPGTYSDVWTSDTQLASSVQVTATDAGRDTLIKWYFVGYTGSRSDTVSYKSYVCPGEVLADGATTFALNNESWLGDRASHRLYATVPGYNGTTFDFSKEIVDSADESAQGYQYSLVAEGQTVIYRLTLDGSVVVDGEARTMTINGASMYDALPLSSESARWSADNVKVTYGTGATVTNGDSWIVTAADEDGQQNIVWGSDFSVTFSGKAYIYVELTFPSGEAWKEYANAYGASTLVNSYHVYDAQRYVTHELQVAATARLQKGVLDTGYFWGSGGSTYSASSYYKSLMDSEDDRLYYQNDDVQLRGVKYYVTLYNAGPTNLYLTDMQDLLPRGFTYNFSNKFSTVTGIISVKKDDGSDASQRNAYVSATASSAADGRQVVTFHFSEYAFSDSVSYDETREMCYLKPGESLSFYYTCRTNGAADTDNAALNAVAMPYYDFNGAGVVVDEACAVTPKDSTTYTPNDGGCEVLADADAQALGYIGGEAGTQWLASDVTVVRGEIKPGITKELTSKTDQYGTTTLNPTSAASTDTLNWTLLAENDGSGAVANYVLTDRMQSPYMFVGDVSCSVYSSASKTVAVAGPYTGGCLFTIGKPADDGTLPITTNSGNTYSLTVGGDPVTMSCRWKYNTNIGNASNYLSKAVEVQLSIAKDADGNAVMSLCLPDAAMSIPEGGHVFLTLSTYNATNTLANKQFINTCFVTPLEQVWDNTTNKGNVTTLETPFAAGELSSVRNSAPVTTTYGYTTSSSKSVAEVGNEDNKASCTADPNYIVLADASKQFRYTLTVNNTTEKAIDKLVLIDNLPEAGDHTTFLADDPRFSEFKVSLAAEPDFSVVVTDKDNNSTVLDVGSYSIEYSTATEFTSQDWNGTSDWSSDASAAQVARSVRLVIEDSAASLIPARSTISFSFTCQIDGDVDPGQVAWNSFGYHYRLDGERSELEAAPLKVGVKVPAIPELRKQVVDHSGQARTVDADATFDFLVYPGTALTGTYSTYEEWAAALEAAGVAYDKFTVTVKAGESLSDTVRMVTDKWVWTAGGKYNVVELPCGEDYAFKRFQGSASKSYTLTYNASQVQVVTCENIAQRWSVKLLKQNTSGSPLADAVFALYSPNAADGLADVPEGYADLDIALTLDHGGATWYLASVQTTPDGGELVWADLLRDQYYLLEVKAPAGYNLSDPAGQVLRRDRETQGSYSLTVINRSGYSLPETGGSGTYPYTTGGLVLLAGAVGLLASRLARRRGEDKRTA